MLESAGVSFPIDGLRPDATVINGDFVTFFIVNNNTTNRGFTGACNLGLKLLSERLEGFSFAWLLNNDTAFESRDQFELSLMQMQTIAAERCWSIVAQQVRDYSLRDRIVFGGALECFPAGHHKSGLRSRGDWALPSEEKWLSFCSVLIRKDLVPKVGLMDETFINYYSDSDYSLQARIAGFKIGYSGSESYVYHKIGQSSHPGEDQGRVLRQDYLAFWTKWLSGSQHRIYLKLMEDSFPVQSGFAVGNLLENAEDFPELQSWLESLSSNQRIKLDYILDHFQHQTPTTPFTVLCNICRELTKAG